MINSKNESYTSAFPENIQAVRYDLEHKDIALSGRLVDAAAKGNWTQVKDLLVSGADPRICRYIEGRHCKSALYFALKAKRFDIADSLFNFGDRLDDLRIDDSDALSGEAVNFLVRAEARGKHFFVEEDKPLSECIRCGLWEQAHRAIKSASRKELNLSVEMICLYLEAWNAGEYLLLLDELRVRGANLELIGANQDEILSAISKLSPWTQEVFMNRLGKYITE